MRTSGRYTRGWPHSRCNRLVQLLLRPPAKHLYILCGPKRHPFSDWNRFGGIECRRYSGVRELPRELDSITDDHPRASRFFIEPRDSDATPQSAQPSGLTLAPTPASSQRGSNGTSPMGLVLRNPYSYRHRRILALEPDPTPVGVTCWSSPA